MCIRKSVNKILSACVLFIKISLCNSRVIYTYMFIIWKKCWSIYQPLLYIIFVRKGLRCLISYWYSSLMCLYQVFWAWLIRALEDNYLVSILVPQSSRRFKQNEKYIFFQALFFLHVWFCTYLYVYRAKKRVQKQKNEKLIPQAMKNAQQQELQKRIRVWPFGYI